MAWLTHVDAACRREVRLPNGHLAQLTFVNRDRTFARAVERASGWHWEGNPRDLEKVGPRPAKTPPTTVQQRAEEPNDRRRDLPDGAPGDAGSVPHVRA